MNKLFQILCRFWFTHIVRYVDSVNSGYGHEATTVAWTTGQDFTSLLDDEWTDLSDEIDNSTLKYLSADFEFALASVFTVTPASLELYIIPTLDGTNYPDWAGLVTGAQEENDQYFAGSVTLKIANQAHRAVLEDVTMPQGKFKIGVHSNAGVTLVSTSTVKFRRHGYSSQ